MEPFPFQALDEQLGSRPQAKLLLAWASDDGELDNDMLNEFVLHAEALKAEDEDAFYQFILTEQVNGEPGHQAVLDPICNILDDD